jgi:hypothetical protein
MLLDLLYMLNYWASLAKMRMHTDTSLSIFKDATVALGHQLRRFAYELCPAYTTTETNQERDSRLRKMNKKAEGGTVTAYGGKRPKTFNLNTIKFHSIGDYPTHIEQAGTSDSYSTQNVSYLLQPKTPDNEQTSRRANWNINSPRPK